MTESHQQLGLTDLTDAISEGVRYFCEYEHGFMSFLNAVNVLTHVCGYSYLVEAIPLHVTVFDCEG